MYITKAVRENQLFLRQGTHYLEKINMIDTCVRTKQVLFVKVHYFGIVFTASDKYNQR
jgi:hypothetical protein